MTAGNRKVGSGRRGSARHDRAVAWLADVRCRVRQRLLRWYDRNQRDLPWRRCPGDAYAQLLAEFMLQQTQVNTVVEYYLRFLSRFPTVTALAAAGLDEVLALWSGLGYYSRARNLHAAARRIVERHGGVVPASVKELMDLPGVGRYTAGAIASIAYGVRAPVLDGNVARVLARVGGLDRDPKRPAVRNLLWAAAEVLVPAKRCGDFNQALMELGATVCVPRAPDCPLCPLGPICRAFTDGSVDRIPPPGRRARVVRLKMVVAAVRRGQEWLLAQRPHRGLWAGLWELPSQLVEDGETEARALDRLRARLPAGSAVDPSGCRYVSWRLTHRDIQFCVYSGRCPRGGARSPKPAHLNTRWVRSDRLDSLPVSNACRAIISAVQSRPPAGNRRKSFYNKTLR